MISAESAVDVSREPHHHIVLENELVRAYWIDLAPGASTQFHHHARPYAGICVGDAVFCNDILGQGAREQHMRDGEVIYTAGGMTHRIENSGPARFQNLTVEVLRGAGHKTSSLMRLEREHRRIRLAIDEPALRVATLGLAEGERLELVGDHLLVWLAGAVTVTTLFEQWTLRRAGEFAWCCGVSAVDTDSGARIAIVEIV